MNEQDETNTTPRAGEGDTGEPGPSESAPGANGAGKADPASNAAGSDAPGPNAAPAQPGVPLRREAKLPVNPKRVRGGVRLKRKEADPDAWTEQRVWRLVEQGADGDHLKEGLEYARNGQTRKITFNDGRVEASIQGRRPRAYVTRLSLPRFSPDDAARSIRSLGEQARFAAKLLAGELPTSIDDVFARCSEEKRAAFVPYLTAGDPDLKRTEELLRAVADAGADLIELGVPFSDPVADGPVISPSGWPRTRSSSSR